MNSNTNHSRSRTRKFLYQMLYASTFNKVELEEFKETFFSWVFNSSLDEDYLKELFNLILENQLFLLDIVSIYAPRFDIKNMDLSYIIPTFISLTELLIYKEEIPLKVSINEAVEIAKVYWDDSSKKIVNWVLHKVSNDIEKLKQQLIDFDNKSNLSNIFKN